MLQIFCVARTAWKCSSSDKFVGNVATRCRKVVQYALYQLTFPNCQTCFSPGILRFLQRKVWVESCQVSLFPSFTITTHHSTLSIGKDTICWSVCFNIKTLSVPLKIPSSLLTVVKSLTNDCIEWRSEGNFYSQYADCAGGRRGVIWNFHENICIFTTKSFYLNFNKHSQFTLIAAAGV